MTPNPEVLKRQEELQSNPYYPAAINFVAKVHEFQHLIPEGHKPTELVNGENPYIDSLMSFVEGLNTHPDKKDREVTDVRIEDNGDLVLVFGEGGPEERLVKGQLYYAALFWLNEKVEAEKKKAEQEKAAGAAAVVAVAAEQRDETKRNVEGERTVKAGTKEQLGALKTVLGDEVKLRDFYGAASLEGKVFQESLLDEPKFLATEHSALERAVLEALKDKDLSPLAEMVGAQGEDLKEVVALFYVGAFLDKLKAAYHPKFDRFKEYADQAGGADLAYKLTVGVNGAPAIEFYPAEVVKAYDEYVEKTKATAAQPQKDADEIAEQAKVEADAKELSKSPIGKLLGILGYGKKGEDGKTGFERLASGQDFLGAFILGLFGYKEFVGDGYQGIVDMMPAKYQRMVQGWEKKAEKSKLHAKWQKKDGAAEGAEGETVASYPPVSADLFGKLLKGDPAPEHGFKLDEEFMIEEGKMLKVDLKDAEVIVPAGKELLVAGNKRGLPDKDDVIEGGENVAVEIFKTLPKGLIFKGAPKFELV